MELTGKIILAQPEQSGMSNGTKQWRRRIYVLEFLPEGNQYERHMAFDVWNDKIDKFKLTEGKTYTVSFDIDLRKYNGKNYNNFTAWKVVEAAAPAEEPAAYAPAAPVVDDSTPELPVTPLPQDDDPSNLPF